MHEPNRYLKSNEDPCKPKDHVAWCKAAKQQVPVLMAGGWGSHPDCKSPIHPLGCCRIVLVK